MPKNKSSGLDLWLAITFSLLYLPHVQPIILKPHFHLLSFGLDVQDNADQDSRLIIS